MGYHRKYAIRLLQEPVRHRPAPRRGRRATYGVQLVSVLAAIWEAAGCPWSVRLKALLPLWLPWARQRFRLSPPLEQALLAISPRQMDWRLQPHRRRLKRRLYGRTKPGTLLKHHIPFRADYSMNAPPRGDDTCLNSRTNRMQKRHRNPRRRNVST